MVLVKIGRLAPQINDESDDITEWEPIETCPNDGTRIRVRRKSKTRKSPYVEATANCSIDRKNWFIGKYGRNSRLWFTPTEWTEQSSNNRDADNG